MGAPTDIFQNHTEITQVSVPHNILTDEEEPIAPVTRLSFYHIVQVDDASNIFLKGSPESNDSTTELIIKLLLSK